MTRMTLERLREVHQARPFKPFRLHLADGRTLHVTLAESLAYNPTGGRTGAYVAPDESTHVVDLLWVSRIEVPDDDGRIKQSK